MAFVHPKSCICVKSELDLFSIPPTQTSIENGTMVEYHPIASIVDNGPIEFNIPGSGEDYLDLANTYLHIGVKIVEADGTDIAADAGVGPVNLLLHSLFSQVDVQLNDKLVTSSANTYAYRAYLETLLNYGRPAKESQLTASLWYKDTAAHMDNRNVMDGENKGLVNRAMFTAESKTVDLVGRIHSDLFFQEKLLLNGINVRIKLVSNKDKFVLMAADNATFKLKIVRAVLRVRKVRIAPAVFLAHAKALERGNAKYPVDRVECKKFTVPAGNLDLIQEHIFLGQIPTRVVIGCVDNEAFNGKYNKNPFNFKNYKIQTVSLQIDGQEQSLKPLECNFENDKIAQAYMNLFIGTGKAFKDEDIDITRQEYSNGYTLFCFDMTPDLGESDHFNLIKSGSIRLKMTFAEALPNTINVVIYAEFQNVLEIDRNRNVFYDYTA